MVEAICWVASAACGASYEVLVRCGGVAAQKLCTARSLVVCLCERRQTNTRRQPQQLWPCKRVFSLRFLYSYNDRKRRSMSFLCPSRSGFLVCYSR